MIHNILKLLSFIILPLVISASSRAVEPGDLSFFKNNPGLLDASSLAFSVDKTVRKPKRPSLGAFAAGGKNAFTLMGLSYPFNTFHNMTTYHHPFFGDSRVGVELDGKEVDFPRESIWYVRDVSIVITKEENSSLAMFTVNFSPPDSGAFVRIVILKALEEVKDARLFADIFGDKKTTGFESAAGTELIQTRDTGARARTLTIGSLDGGARVENGRLVVPVPQLNKGEEKIFRFYYVIQTVEKPDASNHAAILDTPDALLTQTIAWWKNYLDGSTKFFTPDQRLNDMIENLKIAQKIQRAPNGAEVPVVKYADRSHDRENMLITRFYLMNGMPADASEIMKYGWYAAQKEGVIYNSQAADLDISSLPATTDWDNIPLDDHDPIRHVAERPSWTVLQFYRYYKTTGDIELIRKVYPYLRRNILGQEITPEGLLPFHGDEMYQLSMMSYALNASLGDFYSLDSSFAFAAAARGMEEIADALGRPEDETRYAELRVRVEAAIEKYYWQPDDHFVVALRKTDLSPIAKPFPLISLNPAVIGWDRDEDKQKLELDYILKQLRQKDGTIKMARGASLYHGQLPGVLLFNLKKFHNPLAPRIFDLLIHKIADPAGMYTEAMGNNHSHLSFREDTTGLGKEDARRFGPWETTENVAALIDWLTGMAVDAQTMSVRLEPEMPRGWTHWEMRDALVGNSRFDFSAAENGGILEYRFTNKGAAPLSVTLDLPLGDRTPVKVLINGEEQPLSNLAIDKAGSGAIIQGITRNVEKELAIRVEFGK